MSLTAGEIPRIHLKFGRPDELVDRRRAIYRLAVELADSRVGSSDELPTAVVDNPGVRAHLGEVLGGVVAYDAHHLTSMDGFAAARTVDDGGVAVRVASHTAAERVLDGALRRVGAGLGIGPAPALVLDGSAAFDAAARTVVDGVALALDVAPDLAGDLLPHVALFAVLRADSAGRLGSASLREFPGLILLPEPRTPLEVAEALVHEGAHQKFFDLAVTHRILGDQHTLRFPPPWAPPGRAPWPVEQAVAAFHAYCCLSAFAAAASARLAADDLHADSLLPVATDRAALLGRWLHDHGDALGPDGQELVTMLTGRGFDELPAAADVIDAPATAPSERVATRRCGDWTLTMWWSRPAQIVWTHTASTSS